MPLELVAATANPGKLREIEAILGSAVTLRPRPPDVPDVVEDAPTLEGNARLKADAICAATGLPAVADDTGLEVDWLDGAPGVHSARYAGDAAIDQDNVAKLLAELAGVPEPDRTARFRTVAIVVWPDGTEVLAEGVCGGSILTSPKGEGGFGYDPVFAPDDAPVGRSPRWSDLEKNAISHRGRAFRALMDELKQPG